MRRVIVRYLLLYCSRSNTGENKKVLAETRLSRLSYITAPVAHQTGVMRCSEAGNPILPACKPSRKRHRVNHGKHDQVCCDKHNSL